jgi:serine/threonine-protein kinase PknG
VLLPDIPAPALSTISRVPAPPPVGGRNCGVPECTGTIGVAYDGGPPPDHGFCPQCGTPYSFRPQLRPGEEIGEAGSQTYRVLGYLTPGGTSWVYLAEDTALEGQLVVLKAQVNNSDAIARRRAVEELRSLTSLHHRDIVSVISSRRHLAEGETEPTDYIVMEYVGGRPLNLLLRSSDEELAEIFGEPFALDHVLTYGCKLLGALEYLHDQGLLYCDMKPANVIHYGRQIKLIDLGAVRRIDDHESRLSFTRDYAPLSYERERRGFHIDSDLFTVGRTLQELAARAAPGAGLAARSFERLIARATHDDPAARFTSAAQMSRQLWEVLREHRALGRHERHPERSTRFGPTAVLFGAGLGAIPGTAHWTDRPGLDLSDPPDLDISTPEPREAARGLPVPIPDPQDGSVVFLGRLGGAAVPERVAERVERERELRTVEVALWLCRAYLLRGEPESARQANRWLGEAEQLMGRDVAGYDWRLAWHRGLQFLMAGHVGKAQAEFTAVYDIVPGEWAPKLALGYCAERLRNPEATVREFYAAVWERDRSQASAAFGLARARLRAVGREPGAREAAVAVLDQVPSTSRHYDTARVAAIRVLTGRLGPGVPSAAMLWQAAHRVEELAPGESRDRLVAEVRENVLAAFLGPLTGPGNGPPERPAALARAAELVRKALGGGEEPGGPRSRAAYLRRFADPRGAAEFPVLPTGELFEGADSREQLAELLHTSLRALADRAADAQERGALLDRAYAVRPERSF